MFINAKYLWDVLNGSETFEQFQETLSKRGLYDAKHIELYKKIHWDYVGREKTLHFNKTKNFEMFFKGSP